MNVNTKIPEQEFHKLWFYQIRIKFQGLCVHPFNFKILGLSAIFSAIIQSAVCQDFLLFLLLVNPWENCWEKTTVETWLRWVNFCLRLWSSELPSQNMQILQKYSKKCQIFVVLRIRPQGQRPNSKAFKWQLMDYSFRNFSIYDHIRYILRTSDTIFATYMGISHRNSLAKV